MSQQTTRNIERHRVPLYNGSTQNIPAIPTFMSGTEVIDKASDYTVVVETAAIDIANAVLNTRPNYRIMVFCELKTDTNPPTPAGMVYGANYYSYPGEISNVNQVLDWLYGILHKKALPFDLGNVSLNDQDRFELLITPTTYADSFQPDFFRVYFNQPLAALLEELCSTTTPIEAGGELFYQMFSSSANTWVQNVDTLSRINKIESILFLTTTLPITKTYIANPNNGTVRREGILGTVAFNAGTFNLRAKKDWLYVPNVFRHTTLESPSPIASYEINIMIQYTNGDLRALVLSPDERANINLAFYPRTEIDSF
jgi:hypothetical protein